MNKLVTLATGTLAATGLAVALTSPMAAASHGGGGDDVRVSGSCSAGGTWKLKVKTDDGALEVEGEVDTNVVGQTFAWSFIDNGTRAAAGKATTAAPSGSSSVERRIANQPGTDKVVFRATRAGNVCTGSIAF